MSRIYSELQSLMPAGETLIIVYNGGSRPGEERAVVPVALSAEELTAREVGQHQAKSFKLSKIASVRTLDGDAVSNEFVIPVVISVLPTSDHFPDFLPLFEQSAKAGGWHVESTSQSFAVHGFFKNGKQRKTPAVSIQFIDRSVGVALDLETGELVQTTNEPTGRERPWRVDSKRMGDGKSFALLHRAAELFLDELAAAGSANDA